MEVDQSSATVVDNTKWHQELETPLRAMAEAIDSCQRRKPRVPLLQKEVENDHNKVGKVGRKNKFVIKNSNKISFDFGGICYNWFNSATNDSSKNFTIDDSEETPFLPFEIFQLKHKHSTNDEKILVPLGSSRMKCQIMKRIYSNDRNDENKSQNPIELRFVTKQHTYYVILQSIEQMRQWIEKISQAIEIDDKTQIKQTKRSKKETKKETTKETKSPDGIFSFRGHGSPISAVLDKCTKSAANTSVKTSSANIARSKVRQSIQNRKRIPIDHVSDGDSYAMSERTQNSTLSSSYGSIGSSNSSNSSTSSKYRQRRDKKTNTPTLTRISLMLNIMIGSTAFGYYIGKNHIYINNQSNTYQQGYNLINEIKQNIAFWNILNDFNYSQWDSNYLTNAFYENFVSLKDSFYFDLWNTQALKFSNIISSSSTKNDAIIDNFTQDLHFTNVHANSNSDMQQTHVHPNNGNIGKDWAAYCANIVSRSNSKTNTCSIDQDSQCPVNDFEFQDNELHQLCESTLQSMAQNANSANIANNANQALIVSNSDYDHDTTSYVNKMQQRIVELSQLLEIYNDQGTRQLAWNIGILLLAVPIWLIPMMCFCVLDG